MEGKAGMQKGFYPVLDFSSQRPVIHFTLFSFISGFVSLAFSLQNFASENTQFIEKLLSPIVS